MCLWHFLVYCQINDKRWLPTGRTLYYFILVFIKYICFQGLNMVKRYIHGDPKRLWSSFCSFKYQLHCNLKIMILKFEFFFRVLFPDKTRFSRSCFSQISYFMYFLETTNTFLYENIAMLSIIFNIQLFVLN